MRSISLSILFITASLAAQELPLTARVVDSDTQRIASHVVAPMYPERARRDRVEGEVQVCFDIDRRGRPRRIAVRRSSNRVFERPSIRAVKASKFLPLDDEVPLQAIKSCRTFIFSLVPVEE